MKYKAIIFEAVAVFAISCIIGLVVNFFHPEGVKIGLQRPKPVYAADSVLTTELPTVSINDKSKSEPPVDMQGEIMIDTQQVIKLMQAKQAVLLDARNPDDFKENHIDGSINLPFHELEAWQPQIDALTKEKWLICYCDGPPCDLGEMLAFELMDRGFNKVLIYQGGLNAWNEFHSLDKLNGE